MGIRHFIYRTISYGILILILLEGLVRVFHLHKDNPERMIDKYGVEKWVPNQTGVSVTGNRRQNIGRYSINANGFNSYREFQPTENGYEVAILGDSFIEGFHQDYDQSIGKKIEQQLTGVQVYEYGYAGYDLADQLHLIKAYDSVFRKINKIIIYVKYPDDLRRDKYQITEERLRLDKGVYKLMKQSKLLVYAQNIGIVSIIKKALGNVKNKLENKIKEETKSSHVSKPDEVAHKYLENFKHLISSNGFNKQKNVLLLNKGQFPLFFIEYLEDQGFSYLDYGFALDNAGQPVTLIYDQHWNDYGRSLIAKNIVDYLGANGNRALND